MNNRILGIIACVMLMLTTIVIVTPYNTNIKGAIPGGDEGEIELDYQYLWNITDNLSKVIFDAYEIDELQKGREFGTKGEHFAKNYLKTEIENLGLYGPIGGPEPYLDRITKLKYPYKEKFFGDEELTEKINITARQLKINDTDSKPFIVDCYIRPVTNGTRSNPSYNNNELNYNFSYTDLIIINESDVVDFDYTPYFNDTYENVNQTYDFSDDNPITLSDFLESIFEKYYNFTFENLDPDDNTTWPSYLKDIETNEDFVILGETPNYHPDKFSNWKSMIILDPIRNEIWKSVTNSASKTIKQSYSSETNGNCRGFIYYDYTNESFTSTLSGDAELPTIYINGSIGNLLKANTDRYKVDFYLNQTYETNVESYNVIGQINGTDQTQTVILCSLYDSVWTQGTGDAAVGSGTVMTVAKQMKELENENIIPKYKTKFILFGGEEWAFKGAFHYERKYSDENIWTLIDLNQIGMDIPDPEHDPPLILNTMTNRLRLQYLLETLYKRNKYEDKTGYEARSFYTLAGSLSNDFPFAASRGWGIRTITFLKDAGWYLHHRDGMNHSEGDVMKNIDWNDANNTADLVWNLTKFFVYNPDTWFTSDPTFTTYDTTEDGEKDCINVTYSIDTNWPNEQISVNLVLYPKFTLEHPAYPFLYRLREEKNYNVTPDRINGYINISLPSHYPHAEYVAQLYLCNSTGEISLDTIHLIGYKTFINGLELLQLLAQDFLIDILEDCPFSDEIQDLLGIKIFDWIESLPSLRNQRIRDILIDILGYYFLGDDVSIYAGFEMHPPNSPPNAPDKPIDLGEIYGLHFYKTKTTDPDPDDKVRFQWDWGYDPYSTWSFKKYNQNEYHSKFNYWWTTGEKNIRARAKNPWSANVFSSWSDTLTVNVNEGCYYSVVTGQTSQNNVNNVYIQNSYNSNTVVVGEPVSYQGSYMGLSGTPSYSYNFNGEQTRSGDIDTDYTFNQIGLKFVNFTVNAGGKQVYYNTTINVVNTTACFDMDQYGSQPGQIIIYNDTSKSNKTLVNWTWDLGDGTSLYNSDISHQYNTSGIYNVSLTVKDNNNETKSFWQIVHVETNQSTIIETLYSPTVNALGSNITLYAELFDNNESGINSAYVNITYPDGSTTNNSMNPSDTSQYDYEYIFSNTSFAGWYYYTVYVTDYALNVNDFAGCGFYVPHNFGYTLTGNNHQDVNDRISGSNFTVMVNGTADSISAYIQSDNSCNAKCMIYKYSDSSLVGTTEEKTINTGSNFSWTVFNFTGTKPKLTKDTQYILVIWSDDSCNLSYDTTNENKGRYDSQVYGTPPDPIGWDSYEQRLYSIYCSYSTVPEITNVSVNPSLVGFGFNTTISALIEDNFCVIKNAYVNITYPDNSTSNNSMSNTEGDTFSYVFNDNWQNGQYNFTIWAVDKFGGVNCSSNHSFNVSGEATVKVCTIKEEYSENETINLTDPPGESPVIGYELLDGDQVLHMWNSHNSYYFNTSSGIQLTNHKDEYWTQNVLMLGYYNNDEWHLIYRTDELNVFTKNVTSDNETYVNATLWKDLTYQDYDFRLAIRYYLGIDDVDLTVIPYIKNIDDKDIPYVLGFGWEMKDIRIANVASDNYLQIYNGSGFEDILLNQTLDKNYTNMDYNTTIKLICSNPPTYHLSRNLYLSWDRNLTYKVTVKSREGQINAPVTLFIRVGNLSIGQSKNTQMHWLDSDDWLGLNSKDNYDSHCGDSNGHTLEEAIDGMDYWSHTTNHDHHFIIDLGKTYTVKKVRGRSNRMSDPIDVDIFVSDNKSSWGTAVATVISSWQDTSLWQEVDTTDKDGRYIKVEVLDTEHFLDFIEWGGFSSPYITIFDVYGNIAPNVSSPYPSDGSDGISIAPVLNITVSDVVGGPMNISWLSNSSGSWQVFGTNTSVANGTYHQTLSNASENGQWWYWKVNISDEDGGFSVSDVFSFYTGVQSKIVNTGSTNINGYLLIQVHYYNTTTSNWTVADDTINETTIRTISSGGQFGLDTIFNGNVSTTELLDSYGSGTYRIYAAFRDPDGDVLVCDDESLLEASYEFTITTS